MEDDRVCRPNKTEQDLGVTCSEMHGKIWAIDAKPNPSPPLHINCRCWIEPMEAITVEDIQKGQGYYQWREGESEPYENRSGHLPLAKDRTWRVLDIPDEEAAGGMARVIYSNDGLIFLTRDHYRTFTLANIDIFRTFVEVERGKVVPGGSVSGNMNGLTQGERIVVDDLVNQGKTVEIIPRSNIQGESTSDFFVDGVKTELKTIYGTSPNTPVSKIQKGFGQNAEVVLLDMRGTGATLEEVNTIIKRIRGIYQDDILGKIEIWTRFGPIIYGGN